MPKNVNITTFPNLLDLIAPHSCRGCGALGSTLCNRCKNYILSNHKFICPNCKALTTGPTCHKCIDIPPIYIIGERQDLIGTLIHDYKYHSIRALAKPLAELLDATLPKLPINTTIVPLPTIAKHIRARGLDHTLLIAKHLSKLRHHPVKPILTRAADTVQVGTDMKTRSAQASRAYRLSTTIDSNATYLLLDDVWTTGASMLAATKKLQQAGVHDIIIGILALSRIN